jgi:hypothetical protein
MNQDRREFLAAVGRGMLAVSVGPSLASELALAPAAVPDGPDRLTFGNRESLVSLLQDTPAAKLLPILVAKLKAGVGLSDMVAAAALANARTFGGQDYTGYHAFMALAPAYQMAKELSQERRALPVLKVLYRNTHRMQHAGDHAREVLHPIAAAELADSSAGAELLRHATRQHNVDKAERTFAALVNRSVGDAFNALQLCIQDEMNVHRVVLVWRARAMLELTGKEHAHTLLRQSVRFCASENTGQAGIRVTLPKLLDQYKLLGRQAGSRKAEDGWVERLSQTIYSAGRSLAAETVAAALDEGMSPEDIGEAISLAANRLVLCDRGRQRAEDGKPAGSVHGASVGVHASDAANAWRNIGRVSNTCNTFASLICGAYHTAGLNAGQHADPYPPAERLVKISSKEGNVLLSQTEAAIRAGDQAGAAALVHRYGELRLPERPVFDLLLRYGISQDGALHAEKYYRTVTEEFATTRPAFRWRHLVALARVTASEYGFPAPGFEEACRLLKLGSAS